MLGNINNSLLVYFIFINFIGFFAMFLDKRFAQMNQHRISEKTLFGLSIIGGVIGVIFSMYFFRHKTRKVKFIIGLPVILVIQIVFLIYFNKLS